MECPRGSETLSSQHEVKTKDKAGEWCRFDVEEDQLPLTIHQDKTPNGRMRVKIYNSNGVLIVGRG